MSQHQASENHLCILTQYRVEAATRRICARSAMTPDVEEGPTTSTGATVEPGAPADLLSDTERAVYGPVALLELRQFLDSWARRRLGSPIAHVRFRAGRIDVVWGVDLEDGRAVIIKIHRPPVDTDAIQTAHDAQHELVRSGFPCALPLVGPDAVDGHLLTAETLMDGTTPDGRDPAGRRLLADGLARHIDILRHHSDLVGRAGRGPSWCHYQSGPWPVPHDTFVDLRRSRAGSSGSTRSDNEPLTRF